MNTTILDYIVNTIEALFYILTGVIALLTYLSARKTILQPVKTEVFKRQVEVFSSIMELFNGKSEIEIRRAFGFDKMLKANILCLLDEYASVFFNYHVDVEKRPYNKTACPQSMITAEYAERYLVAPLSPLKSESESTNQINQQTVSKEDFWNSFIYGEICEPACTMNIMSQLDEIMKSPFLTSESIRLLSKIKETVEENMLKIGEVLTEIAQNLPNMCPSLEALMDFDISWIENKYNKEFVSIDTYYSELTDYLRKYFKVESIMD